MSLAVVIVTQMTLIFDARAFGACNSGKLNQKCFKGKTYMEGIDMLTGRMGKAGHRPSLIATGLLASIVFPVSAASAQQQLAPSKEAGSPKPGDTGGLEEIIVTATKSGAASLQKVPIAIQAISGETLSARGAEDRKSVV